MSRATLRSFNRIRLATLLFYLATGVILLVFLPLTGFPPHIGYLTVVSLITAYSLFTKRVWAPWLVFILLVTITVFSGYTLYSVGISNVLVAFCMLGYAVLAWTFSVLLLTRRSGFTR